MLEQLSLSLSTALFFLCTAVIGSFFPPAEANTKAESPCAITVSAIAEIPSVVGKWNSGGHTVEFTADGRFIYDGTVSEYTQSGRTLTVRIDIGGAVREYPIIAETISDRVMKVNGITMYRTE